MPAAAERETLTAIETSDASRSSAGFLAAASDSPGRANQLTHTGAVLGTPAYMAPRTCMRRRLHTCVALMLVASFASCGSNPSPPAMPPRGSHDMSDPAAPTTGPADHRSLRGYLVDGHGAALSETAVTITDLVAGKQLPPLYTDHEGAFGIELPRGQYSLAVVTSVGFAWLERLDVPASNVRLQLSSDCGVTRGDVKPVGANAEVMFYRRSSFTGDVFITRTREGRFAACLPQGLYNVSAVGSALSLPTELALPLSGPLAIDATLRAVVEAAPIDVPPIRGAIADVIGDIASVQPALVGLGEATHGTAELATTRATLVEALVDQRETRMVLVENDPFAIAAIDDYVTTGKGDLRKAIVDLGFWTTDTEEMVAVFEALRIHNKRLKQPIHIWGIDVQNTDLPTNRLIDRVRSLSIPSSIQASLKTAGEKRGRGFAGLPREQQVALEGMLARLSRPRSHSKSDLLDAIAARSLKIQYKYWLGDDTQNQNNYRRNRDVGMAELAGSLLPVRGRGPAILWAHNAHIAKQNITLPIGSLLASSLGASKSGYYAIGFYVVDGTFRAWDIEGKGGVISHTLPASRPATVERAINDLAGSPDIAWLPLRAASPHLAAWLGEPHYVRENGAVLETGIEKLRVIADTFDAVVAIRVGHDTTPTATGSRRSK